MRVRALVLAGALFLLPIPAAAMAQSAGNEQYTDPLAGSSPTAKKHSSSTPTSSAPSSGSQSTGTTGASGSTGTTSNSSQAGASSSADPSSSTGLPRTGFNAWGLALMGALMLIAGVLLRLGLRLPRWRAVSASPATLGRDVRLIRRR